MWQGIRAGWQLFTQRNRLISFLRYWRNEFCLDCCKHYMCVSRRSSHVESERSGTNPGESAIFWAFDREQKGAHVLFLLVGPFATVTCTSWNTHQSIKRMSDEERHQLRRELRRTLQAGPQSPSVIQGNTTFYFRTDDQGAYMNIKMFGLSAACSSALQDLFTPPTADPTTLDAAKVDIDIIESHPHWILNVLGSYVQS